MKSSLFEVQNLVQRPTFALAHDFYDAAKLLSDSLTRGRGMRPDADLDKSCANLLREFKSRIDKCGARFGMS